MSPPFVTLKLSLTTLSSITMQYVPCQDLCHRHPFFVPAAFLSINSVAKAAEMDSLHRGHLGQAPALKLPPHRQGRMKGSLSFLISCCQGKTGGSFLTIGFHMSRRAVL